MELPDALIAAFPPSATLLLDLARRQTDDVMLAEIARADYGCQADEMMAELRPIRDMGVVPAVIPWQLWEVLELTRYSNPESPNPPPFEPGPTGRRGHLTRLFACAVLLRAEAEHEEDDVTWDSTLAQCLASAKVLGEEMSDAAARFLTYRVTRRDKRCPEPTLLALGLLILAARLRAGRIAEPVLGTIADWVLARESLERVEFPPNPGEPRPSWFSLQVGFWQPLAAELSDVAKAVRDDVVQTNLQLCALLLEPNLSW